MIFNVACHSLHDVGGGLAVRDVRVLVEDGGLVNDVVVDGIQTVISESQMSERAALLACLPNEAGLRG